MEEKLRKGMRERDRVCVVVGGGGGGGGGE